MTIRFLVRYRPGEEFGVQCPACRDAQTARYEERRRLRKICSQCGKPFAVQVFQDGKYLVE